MSARLEGHYIDRAMVDNISHWDLSCPFVQEEKTFGDTLVDLLRKHQVTTLLTCNDLGEASESTLQRSVIDSADCLLQFHRIEYRGAYHVMFRVLKTRGMRHEREFCELVIDAHKIGVRKISSLLRIAADGGIKSLDIRLFLHHKTSEQREQNDRLVSAIRAVVSPQVFIDEKAQDSGALVGAWSLGSSSALDELQVMQIDEFQLPRKGQMQLIPAPLHIFRPDQWGNEWNDLLPRLRRRIQSRHGGFIGLPMYQNVGLLAHRSTYSRGAKAKVQPAVTSWEELAAQCGEWERENADESKLFFDFGANVQENYNCVFWEVLISLCPSLLEPERQSLNEWFRCGEALRAAKAYRRLCRRSHIAAKARSICNPVNTGYIWARAVVNRVWYSDITQMMSGVAPDEQRSFVVSALPGRVGIAGEWYLSVPEYSAAHDVGLQIIKLLTTHDAELARLRAGVGLPTRSGFYRSATISRGQGNAVSPYFSMNLDLLGEILGNSFQRSSLVNYHKLSGILSAHLERVIELPESSQEELEGNVRAVFDDLQEQMRFVGG